MTEEYISEKEHIRAEGGYTKKGTTFTKIFAFLFALLIFLLLPILITLFIITVIVYFVIIGICFLYSYGRSLFASDKEEKTK